MFSKRTISAVLVVILCIVCFSGCGNNSKIEYKYNGNIKPKELPSGVISQNDNLILSWNNEEKGLSLKVKKTGQEWKNYIDDGNSSTITSTLDITYQPQDSFDYNRIFGDDKSVVQKISAERIENGNGIKITYYFDKVKISVPVTYTLRKDSLLMSIDGSQIGEEGEQYRLISATPSKYFMTVDKEHDDSYIFVSDGIGALIDTKLSKSKQKRDFSLGTANSSSLKTTAETNESDQCGMRAYGIKDKDNSLFGIAEINAGAVGMSVNAGDPSSDYSKVFANMYFVDSDRTIGKASNAGDVTIVSDRLQSKVSIGLYPLSGEDAGYVGMAKCYREFLKSNGLISNQQRDFSSPYAVTALGGVMVTESVLGVPSNKLKVATSFEEAKDLFSSFAKDTGTTPVTRIKGFGESGLNIGKIAGGYTFASDFGSNDSFDELNEYCKSIGKTLYTDFDIIKYSESGNGFSYENDAAKTATLHAAEFSAVNLPLRDYNTNLKYRMLSRTKLGSAVDKLIQFADNKKLSGICLSSFGNLFYSDQTDIQYVVTANMASQTKSYIKKIKESGYKISGSSPAYFSAGLMDTIFDAPLVRTGSFNYMIEIPFYQMVYGGAVPMYSKSLNTASNACELLMLAAASGTGISVSVTKRFETSYMQDNIEKLYGSGYEHARDLIKSSLNSYADIYKQTAGKEIVKYEFLNPEMTLTVTEFNNGTKVYANHSSAPVDSPEGKLGAYGFKMGSGE